MAKYTIDHVPIQFVTITTCAAMSTPRNQVSKISGGSDWGVTRASIGVAVSDLTIAEG